MIWVLIVLAVLLVVVIALQFRGRAAASPESAALLAERTRMLEEEKSRAADLQARLTAANAAAAAQTALASARDAQVKAAEAETAAARQECDVLKDRLALARADVAARDARIVELQKNQAEDHARALKELEDLRTRFNTEFKNIANAIIEEKTTKLNQVNGDSLKPLLDPLNAQLKDFKAKVESLNTESVKERAALGEQVKDLMNLNKTLGKEAEKLVEGLRASLAQAIARNDGKPFGICHGCRHFRRNARPGAKQPHHCALLDAPLSAADSELICVEQAPAA